MGSKFHASKLRADLVSAYRQHEMAKVNKHLDEYTRQCSKMKVQTAKSSPFPNLQDPRINLQVPEECQTKLPFIFSCQIKCEKLVVESEDVVKGITELVSLHGASKLVMGAAADKHFPRYIYVCGYGANIFQTFRQSVNCIRN